MKQREVIFRAEHRSHQIEVVRVTEVLDSPGRKTKVERSLQAFINGVPLKHPEPDQPGVQRDLIELAQAVAEQLPPRVTPDDSNSDPS